MTLFGHSGIGYFVRRFNDNFTMFLLSVAFSILFIRRQVKWSTQINEKNLLPTAFTVKLTNLPKTRPVNTDEVTKLMEEEFGAVEYVTVCVQNGTWYVLS